MLLVDVVVGFTFPAKFDDFLSDYSGMGDDVALVLGAGGGEGDWLG